MVLFSLIILTTYFLSHERANPPFQQSGGFGKIGIYANKNVIIIFIHLLIVSVV